MELMKIFNERYTSGIIFVPSKEIDRVEPNMMVEKFNFHAIMQFPPLFIY